MIVLSFLEQYDLTGKSVYLFNTHGGSGFVGTDDVKKLCRGNVHKSIDGNHLTEAAVREWLSLYLDDGHDTANLVELFESVKNIDHPVVLHIHTIKGKGLPYAEKDRETWHAGGPFHVEDGSPLYPYEGGESVVFNCLKEMLDTDENAIVLNAATPRGLGFVQGVREEYVDRGQFIDVGIAEENAVAMAGGIARNGGTAVFGTFAPFYQRTYDQMSHDVCLNDSPAAFLILSPGAYGMNSNTHIVL